MKKTMLTWDTLHRFETEYRTDRYSEDEIEKIEHAAYVANMNRISNPEWTKEDVYKDFFRVLEIHRVAVEMIHQAS